MAPRTDHVQSVRMSVFRGDSNDGEMVTYDVPVREGMVVLDAVLWIQANLAPDLAVRWNCKAAKCGSCSAEINGKPRLMCMTRMSTFEEEETVTVTPLRTFPVIRDLVTDVGFNYTKAREVKSFTARRLPDAAARTLVGHRIIEVHAKGKNLLIGFDDGSSIAFTHN